MSQMEQFITGETLAQTVLMVRKAQPRARPVMLVEGDKDRRVMRTTLRDRADVVPGHGKAVTLDSLHYLDVTSVKAWLIVVVDADFDRVSDVKHSDLVLLTDVHDMDCEHIRSRSLDKVVQELCSVQKCARHFGKDLKLEPEAVAACIRTELLNIAMPIGLLRLISIQKDYRLAFKKIVDHSKVLKDGELKIDELALVKTVVAAGAKPGVTVAILQTDLNEAKSKPYDPWQICQGHDLCKLLLIAVRKYWGIGRLTVEEIERSMRLAYEAEFFWETNLGVALLARFK
jgi:hypothetical protein